MKRKAEKISDKERLDFIGQQAEKIYYGEVPRGKHGWVFQFIDGEFIRRSGNGSSIRLAIDAAIRYERASRRRAK